MTLMEVVLAMGIMAFGIMAGMELLGKLSHANAQISAAQRLQQRMWDTRALITQEPFDTVRDIFAHSPHWQVSPSAVAYQTTHSAIDPSVGIPLNVELRDTHNSPIFSFEMVKHIDTP